MGRRHTILRSLVSITAAGGLLMACGPQGQRGGSGLSEAEREAHLADVAAWREERDARLRRPDGWLSLAGLFWLSEGDNVAGSVPTADLVVPAEKAPLQLGVFQRRGEQVTFRPAPGAEVTANGEPVTAELRLEPDTEGEPTVLVHGTLSLYAIVRGELVGIRLKDSEGPALQAFEGMEYFPVDAGWRIEARFEPFEPPKTLHIPNVIGIVEELPSPGAAVFTVEGRELRLEPTQEGDELFFVFGDTTNGKETYGGGRFLYTDLPDADGVVVLDFNRAYNPPCVFTPYATCPLPPPDNKLPIPIRAGERSFEGVYGH